MISQNENQAGHKIVIKEITDHSFEEIWRLQKEYQQDLINGSGPERLLICRHEPVFTLGTSTEETHLLTPRDTLINQGYKIFDLERGGSVTYHGPEQIVLYPIIDLTRRRRDVGWYMRELEQIIIDTLASFNIPSCRVEGKTGVWIDQNSGVAKIAFIGVRLSRWRSMHGLALNVQKCSDHFRKIDPCGLGAIEVVSIEELTSSPPDWQTASKALISQAESRLGRFVDGA